MTFFIGAKGQANSIQFEYLDGQILPDDVLAREVMSSDLITLGPHSTIADAQQYMQQYKIHHIPLLMNFSLVGMISNKDLPSEPVSAGENKELHTVMSTMVLAASEGTPIRHIAEVFIKEDINSLPIINEAFALKGILTHRDLIKWLLKNRRFQR